MWKIIFAVIFAGFLLLSFQRPAAAINIGCQCDKWTYTNFPCRVCNLVNGVLECADGECQRATCDALNCSSGNCGPGWYICNRGCCPEGTTSGGTCFPAGTKVMMSSGAQVNIENIKVGDKVASKNEKTGERTVSTVQSLYKPVSDNICEIDFTNKDNLKVTKGHPLYTQSSWKAIDPDAAAKEDPGVPVTRLMIGDLMSKEDGTWPQIASISCKDTGIQTYNFTVDNSHDYFAGGFLAHNKAGCFPAGTKIEMSNGGQKNIEDIKVGDQVVSEDSNGIRSTGTVQALERPTSDHLCTIKYTDGKSLNVTNSHPLYTPIGWKAINPEASVGENPGVPVTRLLPGDFMKNQDGSWPQISSITCRPENNLRVYNFTVDGVHDYFAGGFLAHNKGVCNGCGYDVRQTNPVETVDLTNNYTNPPSVTISWTGANGTCPGGANGVTILIGTDYETVNHDCNIENWVSNAGYAPQYASDICFPPITVGNGPGSINTANYVTLEADKIYYIRVHSWMDFTDSFGDTSAGDCGGVNNPFLASCPIIPNPTSMAVGETKTFSTFGDTSVQNQYTTDNTVFHPVGAYAAPAPQPQTLEFGGEYGHWGPNRDPDCTSMCQGQDWYVDGFFVQSHNLANTQNAAITFRLSANGIVHDFSPGVQKGGYGPDNAYIGLADLQAAGWTEAQVYVMNLSNVTLLNISDPVPNTMKISSVAYEENYDAGHILIQPPTQVFGAPYQAVVNAIAETTTVSTFLNSAVYATSFESSPFACFEGGKIDVTAPVPKDPWWQVKDGDVQTNGVLGSKVPRSLFFDDKGPGGSPGVPAYGGSTDLTSDNVSETKWLANSSWTNSKIFNYDFFANQIPSDVNDFLSANPITSTTLDQATIDSNTTPFYGYYWYKFSGTQSGQDLSLDSALDIKDKKVILLVDSANFKINAPINLDDGKGFFMVIVKGKIVVDPAVGGVGPSLEGIYVADNTFESGAAPPDVNGKGTDIPLHIRGSVVAYNGISFQRILPEADNATTPSELFEFAPDQIMLFPSKLGVRKINWKEVAP